MAGLAIQLFGCFQILRDGKSVPGFSADKIRALVAYLAVEADRPHRRASLAGLLWPEQPEQAARANLRQTLHRIHEALGDNRRHAPYFLVTPQEIQFNCWSDCRVDVQAFREELEVRLAHHPPHDGLCAECLQALRAATGLYRGELLAGLALRGCQDFEWWLVSRREEFHRQALGALDWLAWHYEKIGGYGEANCFAQRAIELEPWREFSHRQKMRALALGGEPTAARRQYETLCRILAREMGSAPTPKTDELYQQICAGALVLESARPGDRFW